MDVRTPAILILLLPALTAGSPFVPGCPEPLSARIASSRAAVVARPIGDGGWQVLAVLKDTAGGVRAESLIRPRPVPPNDATLALLLSFAGRPVESVPLTAAAGRYVRDLPAADAPTDRRLAHAMRYVEDDDPLIAAEAFAELASFDRVEVVRSRATLDRDRLVAAIDDAATPPDRCGVYGDLLGLCGRPDDAARLHRRMTAGDDPFGAGLAGLAVGYLALAGDDGLADLVADVLPNETSPPRLAALLDGFAVHRRDPSTPLSPGRLRAAACGLLARPDAADLAIGHLHAVRDWAATAEVRKAMEAADPAVDSGRAAQVAAVRFLLACRSAADAAPSDRTAAGAALARVVRDDLDLLRRAQRVDGETPTGR